MKIMANNDHIFQEHETLLNRYNEVAIDFFCPISKYTAIICCNEREQDMLILRSSDKPFLLLGFQRPEEKVLL